MYIRVFNHKLQDGSNVKFTIRERIVEGQQLFFANVINTDLPYYKNLTSEEKEICLGVEVTNGKQQTVYYLDIDEFMNDLIFKYGKEWLESKYKSH